MPGSIRRQWINLDSREGKDIQFVQFVRMNKKDKLKLRLVSYGDDAVLVQGSNVSGFTIEAIGNF